MCSTHAMPQRGQDRSPKGAEREEYVLQCQKVRNYLLEVRQISEVDILDFHSSVKIGIPEVVSSEFSFQRII